MIVRLWKAPIERARRDDFREIERAQLEIFQARPGLLGAFFRSAPGSDAAVEIRTSLSLWETRVAAEGIARTRSFGEMLARLRASGMLRGEPELLLFESQPGSPLRAAFGKALGTPDKAP